MRTERSPWRHVHAEEEQDWLPPRQPSAHSLTCRQAYFSCEEVSVRLHVTTSRGATFCETCTFMLASIHSARPLPDHTLVLFSHCTHILSTPVASSCAFDPPSSMTASNVRPGVSSDEEERGGWVPGSSFDSSEEAPQDAHAPEVEDDRDGPAPQRSSLLSREYNGARNRSCFPRPRRPASLLLSLPDPCLPCSVLCSSTSASVALTSKLHFCSVFCCLPLAVNPKHNVRGEVRGEMEWMHPPQAVTPLGSDSIALCSFYTFAHSTPVLVTAAEHHATRMPLSMLHLARYWRRILTTASMPSPMRLLCRALVLLLRRAPVLT